MIRIIEDDKYFRGKWVDNESFGTLIDFIIKIIKHKKIKEVRFGDKYQYLTYTGNVKVSLAKRKNMCNIINLYDMNFLLECNFSQWDEIRVRDDGIDIENIGLYIDFEKSISKEYNEWKIKNDPKRY